MFFKLHLSNSSERGGKAVDLAIYFQSWRLCCIQILVLALQKGEPKLILPDQKFFNARQYVEFPSEGCK